ncbi:MAG: hypothetical protein ABIB43_00575 [archaeon]
MSLGCGEGKEVIRGDFSFVYRLGSNEDGLVFPDDAKDIVPRNSAVCSQHLETIPQSKFLSTPTGIDGIVYGVTSGSGNSLYGGESVSFIGLESGNEYKYLTSETIKQYLPNILKMIGED